MYGKIVTHNDFDGVVSAAICSAALGVRKIYFAGPTTIAKSLIAISEDDIVCDLPYPLDCGLWFDHHEGNLQDLEYRKIDPSTIKGRYAPLKSCARVVFEYFSEKGKLPEVIEGAVKEADVIDSFGYSSIEEWREESPGKIIDNTFRISGQSRYEKESYMREIAFLLMERPIEEIAATPKVKEKFERSRKQEEGMLKLIKESSALLSAEKDCEIILLDLTKYKRRPSLIKNLTYLLYPNASAVLQIVNLFDRGVKTNDLSFSMSLGINTNVTEHGKDIGEIMRTLNIGDGHKGAGAGTVHCKSKQEMLRKKAAIKDEILMLWRGQVRKGGL